MKRLVLPLYLGACAFVGGLSSVWLAGKALPAAWAGGGRPAASELSKLSDRFEEVARKSSGAVVSLEATKPSGKGKGKSVEDSGSGVLVRLPGRRETFVLTNNHVIAGASAGQITVSLADGRIFKPARVWADAESDVAVLQLGGAPDVTTARLGDSDKARVGQWVLAVGSPFGLSQTVTHGILSARERGQVSLGSTIRIKDFLQTDAAINPGSSGGPLLNLEGEVIGINTAIASPSGSNSGVAFSIPINMVKRIAGQLLDKGRVSRGYLGVQLAAGFEPADAVKLGLGRVRGALVDGVHPETPAAAAGLRRNDVILEVDGVGVRNENHFINLISALPAGKRVRLGVWRDRRAVTVEAVVGDWSTAESRFRRER
jgi:serine protease Do